MYRKYNKRLRKGTGFAYSEMSITLQAVQDVANVINSVIKLMRMGKLCFEGLFKIKKIGIFSNKRQKTED